jgi:hypothetical protein
MAPGLAATYPWQLASQLLEAAAERLFLLGTEHASPLALNPFADELPPLPLPAELQTGIKLVVVPLHEIEATTLQDAGQLVGSDRNTPKIGNCLDGARKIGNDLFVSQEQYVGVVPVRQPGADVLEPGVENGRPLLQEIVDVRLQSWLLAGHQAVVVVGGDGDIPDVAQYIDRFFAFWDVTMQEMALEKPWRGQRFQQMRLAAQQTLFKPRGDGIDVGNLHAPVRSNLIKHHLHHSGSRLGIGHDEQVVCSRLIKIPDCMLVAQCVGKALEDPQDLRRQGDGKFQRAARKVP